MTCVCLLRSEIFAYFSSPCDCFIRVYCEYPHKSTDDRSIIVTVNFLENYYCFMTKRPTYKLKIIWQ